MPANTARATHVGADVDGVRAREADAPMSTPPTAGPAIIPNDAVGRLQRERGRPQLLLDAAAAAASAGTGKLTANTPLAAAPST